ncbi:MAG: hypothetical protein ABI895_13225 [Deltaproteobacteria bacterium]
MNGQTLRRRQFLSFLGGVSLLETLAFGAFGADHVIVVNKGLGLVEATLEKMRKILSLRQAQWDNGAPVLLVLPPRRSAPMVWLSEELLQMPEVTYRRLLLAQVFRGAARPPLQAESIAAVAQAVASKPNTLSALPRALLTEGLLAVTLRAGACFVSARLLAEALAPLA